MDTNIKGDIALTQVIADLTIRGCDIFVPINDHPKSDIVFSHKNTLYKCQVKYSTNGFVANRSVGRSGNVKYKNSEIDVFAVYIPDLQCVLYVPYNLGGITIRWEKTSVNRPCWWYEDFKNLDFHLDKKQSLHYNGSDTQDQTRSKELKRENWPEKELLEVLVWEMPSSKIAKEYGVSDRMVGKWCEFYDVKKPPRGYWTKMRKSR